MERTLAIEEERAAPMVPEERENAEEELRPWEVGSVREGSG